MGATNAHLGEQNELQFAVLGGLICLAISTDPSWTFADRLVRQVLGGSWVTPSSFC